MKHLEQIVSKIRALEPFDSTAKTRPSSGAIQDLAEQYANACNSVNQRLQNCAELLSKGMRSEAIQTAEQSPSLLDAVVVLDFSEREAWDAFCRGAGLAVPPTLNEDAVDRLNAEYGAATSLEPLIQKYRKLVRTGTLDEKVEILRRIHALDSGNQIWLENLRPLEEEQLKLLTKRAKGAVEEKDLASLKAINESLGGQTWLISIPETLTERLTQRIQELSILQANDDAEGLLSELTAVIKKKDHSRLGPLLASWKTTSKTATIELAPSQRKALRAASQIVKKAEEAVKRQTAFEQAVHKLEAAVESPDTDKARLEQALAQLSRFTEFDQPLTLVANAQGRLRTIEIQQQRKTRLRMIAIVGGLILIGALIALVARSQSRQRELDTLSVELQKLVDEREYQQASSLLSSSIDKHPYFADSLRLQAFQTDLTARIAQRETELEEFAALQEQLDQAREEGFAAADVELDRILGEAEARVWSEQQRLWLDRWRVDRKIRAQALLQEKKSEFMALIEQLQSERDSLLTSAVDASAGLERVRSANAALVRIRALLEVMPDEWQELVGRIEKDLLTKEEEFLQIATIREEAKRLGAEIGRKLDTRSCRIQEYVEYVEAALASKPENPQLSQLLGIVHMAERATILSKFSAEEDHANYSRSRLQELRDKSVGSVWEASIAQYVDSMNAGDTAQLALRDELRENRFLSKIQTFEYRKRGSQSSWRKRYFLGNYRENSLAFTFFDYIQVTDNGDLTLEQQTVRTTEWDVRLPSPGDAEAPHVSTVRLILERSRVSPRLMLPVLWMNEAEKLALDTRINAIPRARIVRALMEACIQASPGLETRLQAIVDSFPEDDVKRQWFNMEHVTAIETRKVIAKFNQESFPLLAETNLGTVRMKYEAQIAVLLASLSRRVDFVGVVERGGHTRPRGIGASRELWALNAVDGEHFVMLDVGEASANLLPGTPLLAPIDTRSTLALSKKYNEVTVWPDAWPRNGRGAAEESKDQAQ